MIEGRVVRDGLVETATVPLGELASVAPEGGAWIWIDVVDPTDVDLAELQRAFDLHPLAVEDARHRGQAPKVEIFEEHAFVVLRPLSVSTEGDLHETEIHAFVSERMLLTLRFTPVFELRPMIERCGRQPELASDGAGFALYALLDAVTDGYLIAAERLEDVADGLEDHMFGEVDEDAAFQADLLRLRRGIVTIRRRASPMRQGVEFLEQQPFVSRGHSPYFRDVVDHLLRVVEMVDSIRDLLMSLLDVRSAQASNRLNEVMRSLTAWATILLVPTLLAGIWGMNFRDMPELKWQLGYPAAIVTIFGTSFALYAWFRWKKRWL